MSATTMKKLTPSSVLKGESPLVLKATLEPIAGDRFQPAGFPEIGKVIYKAPRKGGKTENVCIVDSAASMANHLEAVCQRSAHDLDLVDDLAGMPYLRCVTGDLDKEKLKDEKREVVVTSLSAGHRVASSYFLGMRNKKTLRWDGRGGQRVDAEGKISPISFGDELAKEDKFGIALDGTKVAHPPPEKWWNIFRTIFHLDPNSLVHGVFFPQWQVKVSRALAPEHEALGANRVARSGVKFDRLGKTASGQPIFAVDDVAAESIHATFILDVGFIRSLGREKTVGGKTRQLGLEEKQKEFLIALALWKIQRLLRSPFRFRSGCHLRCTALKSLEQAEGGYGQYEQDVKTDVSIAAALQGAGFNKQPVTDVFWPRNEIYREPTAESDESLSNDKEPEDTGA